MSPAVIFDFDGLLVDTETAEYEAWRWMFTQHGASLDEETWLDAVGYDGRLNPRAMLEEQVGRVLDWEKLNPIKRQHHFEIVRHLPPLPGAVELFDSCVAAGYRIGVASNSSDEWVRSGLERIGFLKYVQVLATRNRVASPKPAPDVYLLALEELEAAPDQTVAFEDSEPGVRAAKAAGLRVIAVPNNFTRKQDLSMADQILNSLAEVRLGELF